MRVEVEVAAVGDALELGPADREQVLDVGGPARVVRQLVGVVRAQAQVVAVGCRAARTSRSRSAHQYSYHCSRLVGRDEELHLHLLELARAEDEVAGRDLVAERLADLRDPERRLLARELQRVLEVEEDALRGLGTQVGDRAARRATGPTCVSNIRLNCARLGRARSRRTRRAASTACAGTRARRGGRRGSAACTAWHSTSGSLNPARWPDASHVCGCWMIAESSATTSSRSKTIACHHASLTLFLSRTP